MAKNTLMAANVEVLDAEICKECKLFEVKSFPKDIFCGFDKVRKEHYYRCERLHECRYLHELFASKTPPKVEEAKSDP